MRTWRVLFVLALCAAGCADTSDGRWPVQVLGDRPMGLWGPKDAAPGGLCGQLRRRVDAFPAATPLPGFDCSWGSETEPAYFCYRKIGGLGQARQLLGQVRACFPDVEPEQEPDEEFDLEWRLANKKYVNTGVDEEDSSFAIWVSGGAPPNELCEPLYAGIRSVYPSAYLGQASFADATPLPGFSCEIRPYSEPEYACRRAPVSHNEGEQLARKIQACLPHLTPKLADVADLELEWKIGAARFVKTDLDDGAFYVVISPRSGH